MFTKILQSLCIFYLPSTRFKNLLSKDLLSPVHGRQFYVINLTNEYILSLCAGVEHGHSKFNKYVDKFSWSKSAHLFIPSTPFIILSVYFLYASGRACQFYIINLTNEYGDHMHCFARGWCMNTARRSELSSRKLTLLVAVRASLLSWQAHQSVSNTQTERGNWGSRSEDSRTWLVRANCERAQVLVWLIAAFTEMWLGCTLMSQSPLSNLLSQE
jgi:hypothetical protein